MLIAARNGFLAGGKPTAKSYVQDGLVAMWDVTSLRGGTWRDLVGNHDFTVGTGVTKVGNMVQFMDGRGCTSNWQMAPGDIMTFEIVLKLLSAPSSGNAVTVGTFSSQYAMSGYQVPYRLLNVRNINNEIYIKNAGYLGKTLCQKVSLDGVATLAWSYNAGSALPYASYKDGVSTSTKHNYGSAYGGNAFVKGSAATTFEIGCIRSYSRDLTADEIAANYAIDKERFNLP